MENKTHLFAIVLIACASILTSGCAGSRPTSLEEVNRRLKGQRATVTVAADSTIQHARHVRINRDSTVLRIAGTPPEISIATSNIQSIQLETLWYEYFWIPGGFFAGALIGAIPGTLMITRCESFPCVIAGTGFILVSAIGGGIGGLIGGIGRVRRSGAVVYEAPVGAYFDGEDSVD